MRNGIFLTYFSNNAIIIKYLLRVAIKGNGQKRRKEPVLKPVALLTKDSNAGVVEGNFRDF